MLLCFQVLSELEQEEVRPITPDREALEAISRTVTDRAEHVAMVQKELLDAQNQQDLIDEQELYAEVGAATLVTLFHNEELFHNCILKSMPQMLDD